MFFSFEFPFLDIRSFLSIKTYKLTSRKSFDFCDVANHEFVRSFGEIRQRKNPHEVSESIYATANNAVKFDHDNAIVFGSSKKFIPHCIFKRLFTNGINCRVDIGVENSLKTTYSNLDIEEIMTELFYSTLYVPQKSPSMKSYHKIDMRSLGKRLAVLYLNATTEAPKVNFSDVRNNWVVHGNPMILIEAYENDLRNFDATNYTKIQLEELERSKINMFFHVNSNIISGYNIPIWIIIRNESSEKDRVRNLRIYLMRLHQARECFRQTLRIFFNEIFNSKDFDENYLLRDYVEDYIYTSLLKKKRYGFSNDEVNRIVERIDESINHHQINKLIEYFSTAKLKSIEERCGKNMKGQKIEINHSKIIGSQVGVSHSELQFEVDGDVIIDSNPTDSKILREARDSISSIMNIADLSDEQKAYLISLINEATQSAEENDDSKKTACKVKFDAFILGAGKIAERIITVLGNFSTIAGFLGIIPK